MKRFLSVLLVLATLFTAFPLAVSAAETTTETTGLGDYRDLYVKDGLAALFTAYESTASDTAVTSWAPANYFGIKGYDSYLDPTTYSHTLTSTWKPINGALHSATASTAFDLSALGAKIGTTWSVQTVWQILAVNNPSRLANITQETVENEDGSTTVKNVVSNYTSITSYWGKSAGFENGHSAYGPLRVSHISVPAYYSTNERLVAGWFIQLTGRKADNSGASSANVFFCRPEYGMKQDTFYFTKADGTESSFVGWTSEWPLSVMEQTVARLGDGVAGDATQKFSWRFTYQFAPTRKASTPNLTSRTFTHTSYAASDSTSLKLLVGKNAYNYSIRVYTKDLSLAEIDQNHFADLCGFYGVDVSELLTLSEVQLAYVAGQFTSDALLKNKYNADGTTTDAFAAAKTAFEAKLAPAVKLAKSAFKEPDTYELLYVKDGLVALFNAHSAIEEMGTVTSWTPVNLTARRATSPISLPPPTLSRAAGRQRTAPITPHRARLSPLLPL